MAIVTIFYLHDSLQGHCLLSVCTICGFRLHIFRTLYRYPLQACSLKNRCQETRHANSSESFQSELTFPEGGSDVALFTEHSKGLVVNGAINRYAYATLRCERQTTQDDSVELQRILDKSIRIYSADFDTFIEADDVRQLEYDGNIDLVKAAVRRMSLQIGGFDLITQSKRPPG